jgi:hypothetical protein
MRSDSLKRRLAQLEQKSGVSDAVLRFADGSTRSITIRHKNHKLQLFCAAMDRTSYFLGPPEGRERSSSGPPPVSKFDRLIDLFGTAESVEADDVFLRETVFGVCKGAIEEGKKNPSKSAQKLAEEGR